MQFKHGDRVMIIRDFADPMSVKYGMISSVNPHDGTVKIDGDYYYSAFVFPISAKDEVLEILNKRAELKRMFEDSMSLVHQLSNKKSRGEFPQ